MDIKWLKTFIIASKYENFRQTAEELFLTQQAVTKHIKRLEETLNIQLFERIGKKVVLTQAGHKFLPTAKEIVSKFEHGMEHFESWKQGYSKKLIIAAAPQIASSILPPILRKFMDKHPEIEVLVHVLKSYEIGEEISAGTADVGLARVPPVQTNIKSRIIHKELALLVAPYSCMGASCPDEQTILEKYRIITHNHPEYWDDLLKNIKKHYPAVRTMKVDQIEVTKRFIEEGLGVSYLPYSVIKDEINGNKLLKIDPKKISPPISSTYVLTKVETDEAAIFIKFLEDALKN